MDSHTEQRDGQADELLIRDTRQGRDGSLLIMLVDEPWLQLSSNQIAVLVTLEGAGRACPVRELHAVVFNAVGAATASRRASLSRLLRRLAEQGLVARDGRSVRLTPRGGAVAAYLVDIERKRAQRGPRDQAIERELLKLTGCAAAHPVNQVRGGAA